MKIVAVSSWVESIPLTRPYTITFRDIAGIETVIVELVAANGLTGLGAASPEPYVTGETNAACQAALARESLQWLLGRDLGTLPALCRELRRRLPDNPAARAAVDIALHDLLAQALDLPLVELLGRAHVSLPTSITIGIKPLAETLAEAREYLGRGFRVLKLKLGRSLEEDLERLKRVRRTVGPDIAIRVDPNQGYSLEQLRLFLAGAAGLDIELVEQPTPVAATADLRALPAADRRRLAADESLLDESDALRLSAPPRPCGIFNIKLMKCGGLYAAGRIAAIAETAGVELMWGCMDESRISISAALHAALAAPATRYLDLDGSFDLARDVATGGFVLENGCLRTTAAPGLGLRRLE